MSVSVIKHIGLSVTAQEFECHGVFQKCGVVALRVCSQKPGVRKVVFHGLKSLGELSVGICNRKQ